MLEVANSGLVLAVEQVEQLTEPFRRINGERAGNGRRPGAAGGNGARADRHGLGLGLSIVDAIAAAHGARLEVGTRPQGGLTVQVMFAAPGTDLPSFYTEKHDVSAIGRLGDPGCAHR